MIGSHKFKVGQRVRPSSAGRRGLIFPKTRLHQTGIVVKVDEFNSPTVLWEGRKKPLGYYAGFIELDRRRRAKRSKS